jgi:predicted enzyme related to lactoylglutathione lyase
MGDEMRPIAVGRLGWIQILAVEDIEAAAHRVETLGGRRLDDFDFHEHGYSWRRMADPDGNEFCLIYDL